MGIKLHLKEEGFYKILSIKEKMNQNRRNLKDYQPPHTIPLNKSYLEIDPNYISGFITGDGYLSLISKKDSPSFGRISFGVNQHINNKALIEEIANALELKSAARQLKETKDSIELIVSKKKVIKDQVIPYFKRYLPRSIRGDPNKKAKTLLKIIEIIKVKEEKDKNTPISGRWTSELKDKVLEIWYRS